MSFSLALNFLSESHLEELGSNLQAFNCKEIFVSGKTPKKSLGNSTVIGGYGIEFGSSLIELVNLCRTSILALLIKPAHLRFLPKFNEWINQAEVEKSAFSYSAHQLFSQSQDEVLSQPALDYQFGSVRDDFDFGPLVLLNVEKIKKFISTYPNLLPDNATALYGLRLAASLDALPFRFSEPSYQAGFISEPDGHQAHFAYVSSAGAGSQKSFEGTFTEFSKLAGFYLPSAAPQVVNYSEDFKYEASVIIPVKNRAGKVEHAVKSALDQKVDFSFNVIVVDNHSNDGSSETLLQLSKQHGNLVHLVPKRQDLGIGGCWQLAIESQHCGRFAVQLDSDDLYSSDTVLQRIVQEFHKSKAAAVVGSYLLVDRDLNEIPPGAVEHREWTDSNGHNNALRINGFGAPRAYYTPVIREIGFPNVSYGEDYFAMLAISRTYKIARIYDYLYLCRRWEGNSDAAPSIEKMNKFHQYKDSVRSREIELRKQLLAGKNC